MKSTSDTYIPEEIMSFSDLKLFALSSNQELAKRVAQEIGIELGKSSVRQFSDAVSYTHLTLPTILLV